MAETNEIKSPHPFDNMTESELRTYFATIAEVLTRLLPADTGFILLAAPTGTGGISQLVANVPMDVTREWVRETAERFAAGEVLDR